LSVKTEIGQGLVTAAIPNFRQADFAASRPASIAFLNAFACEQIGSDCDAV